MVPSAGGEAEILALGKVSGHAAPTVVLVVHVLVFLFASDRGPEAYDPPVVTNQAMLGLFLGAGGTCT